MIIKTCDLEGSALDWAVAKSQGDHCVISAGFFQNVRYSTDWAQGGPLIERFDVWIAGPANIDSDGKDNVAWVEGTRGRCPGGTKLIAAMRAIVAAELGDEVDVPDELGGGHD